MYRILFIYFFFCLSTVLSAQNPKHVYIEGYYREDGTYVRGHYKTEPNTTNTDNFSTRGNVNPYTGKKGWIEPDYKYSSKNSNYSYNYSYSPKKVKPSTPITINNNDFTLVGKPYSLLNPEKIYKKPSAKTKAIQTAQKFSEVKVIASYNSDWFEIIHKNKVAYIQKNNLRLLDESLAFEKGIIEYANDNYENALYYLLLSENYCIKCILDDNHFYLNDIISHCYYNLGDFKKSIIYSSRSINYIKQLDTISVMDSVLLTDSYYLRIKSKQNLSDYFGIVSDCDFLIDNYLDLYYYISNDEFTQYTKAKALIELKEFEKAKPDLQYCLLMENSFNKRKAETHFTYAYVLHSINPNNKEQVCNHFSIAGELGMDVYEIIQRICQ